MVKLLSGLIVVGVCFLAGAIGYRHFRPNGSPQAIETSNRAKVRISWTVQSSQGVYGFTIYRGFSADGPWTRVNSEPILAADGGTTNIPHDYEYIDTTESLVLGTPCWYWLETIQHDGTRRRVKWPPEPVIPKVRIHEEFPPTKTE